MKELSKRVFIFFPFFFFLRRRPMSAGIRHPAGMSGDLSLWDSRKGCPYMRGKDGGSMRASNPTRAGSEARRYMRGNER